MRIRNRVVTTIGLIAILVLALWLLAPNALGKVLLNTAGTLERTWYWWVEVPAISREIDKIPNAKLEGVDDTAPPDETSFHVSIRIEHKGLITFYNPTAASFSGTNDLISVIAIGSCQLNGYLGIGVEGDFDDMKYDNISDVLAQYDLILSRAIERGLCKFQ